MAVEISRETWSNIDSLDDRLSVLFDIMVSSHSKLDLMCKVNDKRFKVVEKHRASDTAYSAAAGIIGGMIAVIFNWKFFRMQ